MLLGTAGLPAPGSAGRTRDPCRDDASQEVLCCLHQGFRGYRHTPSSYGSIRQPYGDRECAYSQGSAEFGEPSCQLRDGQYRKDCRIGRKTAGGYPFSDGKRNSAETAGTASGSCFTADRTSRGFTVGTWHACRSTGRKIGHEPSSAEAVNARAEGQGRGNFFLRITERPRTRDGICLYRRMSDNCFEHCLFWINLVFEYGGFTAG